MYNYQNYQYNNKYNLPQQGILDNLEENNKQKQSYQKVANNQKYNYTAQLQQNFQNVPNSYQNEQILGNQQIQINQLQTRQSYNSQSSSQQNNINNNSNNNYRFNYIQTLQSQNSQQNNLPQQISLNQQLDRILSSETGDSSRLQDSLLENFQFNMIDNSLILDGKKDAEDYLNQKQNHDISFDKTLIRMMDQKNQENSSQRNNEYYNQKNPDNFIQNNQLPTSFVSNNSFLNQYQRALQDMSQLAGQLKVDNTQSLIQSNLYNLQISGIKSNDNQQTQIQSNSKQFQNQIQNNNNQNQQKKQVNQLVKQDFDYRIDVLKDSQIQNKKLNFLKQNQISQIDEEQSFQNIYTSNQKQFQETKNFEAPAQSQQQNKIKEIQEKINNQFNKPGEYQIKNQNQQRFENQSQENNYYKYQQPQQQYQYQQQNQNQIQNQNQNQNQNQQQNQNQNLNQNQNQNQYQFLGQKNGNIQQQNNTKKGRKIFTQEHKILLEKAQNKFDSNQKNPFQINTQLKPLQEKSEKTELPIFCINCEQYVNLDEVENHSRVQCRKKSQFKRELGLATNQQQQFLQQNFSELKDIKTVIKEINIKLEYIEERLQKCLDQVQRNEYQIQVKIKGIQDQVKKTRLNDQNSDQIQIGIQFIEKEKDLFFKKDDQNSIFLQILSQRAIVLSEEKLIKVKYILEKSQDDDIVQLEKQLKKLDSLTQKEKADLEFWKFQADMMKEIRETDLKNLKFVKKNKLDHEILSQIRSDAESDVQSVTGYTNSEIGGFNLNVQTLPYQAGSVGEEQKRLFYSEAVSIKMTLPPGHPGKEILIQDIYNTAMNQGVQKNQWETFIRQKLNGY